MDTILAEFEAYLFQEKKMARNSLQAYRRDVRGFVAFLEKRDIVSFAEVNHATVISYVLYLKKEGRSTTTIHRKMASLRSFFRFLERRGDVQENPVEEMKRPKLERSPIEYLTLEEVEILLEQPDQSPKGLRDRSILELLYATGMRVSEVVELDVHDIHLKMGFVACGTDEAHGRIIPMGRACREAVARYLSDAREQMTRDPEEKALFVNYRGERLTRQGLWKIIKYYADKAGVEKRITPQILRHSFAVHMLQNGADLKSLQELLGHGDAAATQVYLMASESNIKDVYEKAHPRA